MSTVVIVGTSANIEAEYGAKSCVEGEFALVIMDDDEIVSVETFQTEAAARRAARECSECTFEYYFS